KVDEAGRRWCHLEITAETDQNVTKIVPLSSQRFVHYTNLSSCAKRRKQEEQEDDVERRWGHLETTAETDQNVTKIVPLSLQRFVRYMNLSSCAKRRK